MINQKQFFDHLKKLNVEFFTGVPDSLLNEFCAYASATIADDKHIIAANEGNAIALAAGYHLATGTVPLVYMQNSGIGNALNPLISLASQDVYSLPMVLLIGWRGDPAVADWAQHTQQGALTTVLLDDMHIPYQFIDTDDDSALEKATWAVQKAHEIEAPTALIAKKGMFEKGKGEQVYPDPRGLEMTRETAMECILDSLPGDTCYVATTGRASRELHALRKLRNETHGYDFLNVGAMGHASQIATGLATADRSRQIVCLDGDGAALMHLGGLAVTGTRGLSNILQVILNNGAHESVGGQLTVGYQINYTQIAAASGYATLGQPVETAAELRGAIAQLETRKSAGFIDVHIRQGLRTDIEPLRITHSEVKRLFIQTVRGQNAGKA